MKCVPHVLKPLVLCSSRRLDSKYEHAKNDFVTIARVHVICCLVSFKHTSAIMCSCYRVVYQEGAVIAQCSGLPEVEHG